MRKLRVLDLFSGIGGFSLGLERTGGFETVAFCEIEPFPRRVLAKHWPEVTCYHDVRTLTADVLARDGIAVDVITGGFPCQDLSVAGKQRGMGEGTRSGLWSEIDRLVGELRPSFVILENVANLLSGPSERRGAWFGRILGDLAERGYNAEWENIPAAALGAPHRRERVWIVGHPCQDDGRGIRRGEGLVERIQLVSAERHKEANKPHRSSPHVAHEEKRQGSFSRPSGQLLAELGRLWASEPDVGRVANGVPQRVDRLAALGNSVVPQIPELIGRAILADMQRNGGLA